MSGSAETGLYVKGRDLQLDKRYSEYKKLNLWSGLGLSCALSKEEGDSLIDLWQKDQRIPWKFVPGKNTGKHAWTPSKWQADPEDTAGEEPSDADRTWLSSREYLPPLC